MGQSLFGSDNATPITANDAATSATKKVRKSGRNSRTFSGRRYNVIACKFDRRYKNQTPRVKESVVFPNLSLSQANDLKIELRKEGYGRIDVIEVTTTIPDGDNKRKVLEFSEKNFVSSFTEGSETPSYVEPRMTQRMIVLKNIAKGEASAKKYHAMNQKARQSMGFGPREIRVIR